MTEKRNIDDNQDPSLLDIKLDFSAIFETLRFKYMQIGLGTSFIALAAIIYALLLPNIYQARIVFVPAENSVSKSGGVLESYGSIARMAGISLPGNVSRKSARVALEILQSETFLRRLIKKHSLKPDLVAADGWDVKRGRVLYNTEIYDEKASAFLLKDGISQEPTSFEAVRIFKENLKVEENGSDSPIFSIYINHRSPVIAMEWCNLLLKELNETMKAKSITEAQKSINYLKQKIEENTISEIDDNMYSMLTQQIEAEMLASIREDHTFTIIDPAYFPEERFSPSRSNIVIMITLIGGLLNFLLAFYAQKKSSTEAGTA